MTLSAVAVAITVAWAAYPHAQAQEEKVNRDAQVLADYQKRVEGYLALQRQALKDAPKLEQTDDPAKIQTARDARAAAVRKARAGAAQGDIFTAEVRPLFRRILSPETKGAVGEDTKRTIKEDAPTRISFKVNASYPEDQPLPTVPPNVLASLPRLPEGLEYRIIRRHLILRDAEANLIVDILPNVMRQ